MKFYDDNPNFSVVLPGGCNAACEFCFWKESARHDDYLQEMLAALAQLPRIFTSVSITGGEPTLSRDFEPVLRASVERFDKVVISTNGAALASYTDLIAELCESAHICVNISRHQWDDKTNADIFSGDTPSSAELEEVISRLSRSGVTARANCVLCGQFNGADEVRDYLRWARGVGFYAVAFRKQHSDLGPSHEQRWFDDYKVLGTTTCPVCESTTQLIDGVETIWKSSVAEPSEAMRDIYELVLHPDCSLTLDWEGNKPAWARLIRAMQEQMQPTALPRDYSSPGRTWVVSGSCGVGGGGSC